MLTKPLKLHVNDQALPQRLLSGAVTLSPAGAR